MSITQERFMQFADLAVTAFNAKTAENQALAEENLKLKEQLVVALSNDKADADKIVQAENDAALAKQALADSITKSQKENQDLIDAINALQDKLGIPTPTPVEPTPAEPVEEVPAA